MDTKKKIAGRILSVAGSILVVLLIALIIFLVANQVAGRVPMLFGRAIVRIQTGSMEPEIPTGAYILLRPASPEDIKPDDIITFYSDDPVILGKPNTHRVLEVAGSEGERRFVTKGDANPIKDSVDARGEALIGVYVRTLPVITAVASFFYQPAAFFLLIFIPSATLLLLCALEVIRRAQALRREARIQAEVERLKETGWQPDDSEQHNTNHDPSSADSGEEQKRGET